MRTWREIRDLTGLSEKSLNTALSEMFNLAILEKRGDAYRVIPEIYKEYKEFLTGRHPLEKNHTDKTRPKFSEDEQKALVDWIDQWRTVKKLEFSLEDKHFFLVGRHLDELSKELIANAKTEVLAVNPYVSHCDLSNTLRDATKHGVAVNLVTRPPEARRKRSQHNISEYHKRLKEDGVEVLYNKAVHAKLIVVDRAVAISSSMNFFSTSSSGASWEAGLVTVEEKVVESVVNSILELLEKPESVEMSKLAN
jgi:phosphatidylserine/phosphatidylglycerophosphate/cardiolipin synthase-like enzyme